jgi:hypothetical protein
MSDLGKMLIVIGAVSIVLGVLLTVAGKISWLGRLPGDIVIERGTFRFYFPLASCVIASVVISLLLWLLRR